MFDLVADVERYPEFVPLCRALKVRTPHARAGGRRGVIADMTVAYKLVRETFTAASRSTSRTCRSWSSISKARSVTWKTAGPSIPIDEHSCEVEFFIAYEFRSRTLGMLMGAMFDLAFRRFAVAFEHRADVVYPRVSSA